MKHLGDITKLHGYSIPVVDIITGGSPCQDLSVAGLREGLKHLANGDDETTRSGLFFDQIRIVKEMRELDKRNGRHGSDVRPRYMVWENVPGAFSSNGGKDFQAVLSEIVRIVEPDAPDVPMPDKGGWAKAGCLYGELGNWSIAYKLHDAQFHGVPQRRRRLSLVCDFNGLTAPDILFDPQLRREAKNSEPHEAVRDSGAERGSQVHAVGKSLSGHSDQSKAERQGTPGGSAEGTDGTGEAVGFPLFFRPENTRLYDEKSTTICNGTRPGFTCGVIDKRDGVEQQTFRVPSFNSAGMMSDNPNSGFYESELANFLDGQGGNPACWQGGTAIVEQSASGFKPRNSSDARSIGFEAERSPTINADGNYAALIYDARGNGNGNLAPTITCDHQNRVTDYTALCVGNGQLNQISMEDTSNTLDTMHDQQAVLVSGECDDDFHYCPETGHALHAKSNLQFREDSETYVVAAVDCRNGTENESVNGSLQAQNSGGTKLNSNSVVRTKSIVRRLTPTECCRLQGYPSDWLDIGDYIDGNGKKRTDNDTVKYRAAGNSIALPFWAWLFRRINAHYERQATMGSLFDGIGGFPLTALRSGIKPLWASEIEAFPIAVCKKHFGDEDAGIEGDIWKYL